MANASIEIEIKALDKASKKLDDIGRSLNPLKGKVGKLDKEFGKVDKSINKASGSFGKFKGLLAGALTIGGITAFTKSVVEASSRAEDLKTTLETVTGSAQEGDKAFKFINDFATRTPFDIETLTETFIKLKAAGIEPTEKLLTQFGDMASVTTDRIGSLNAITDLFARTTAGGLGLEDLNRLADRGVPVFDIFQQKLGLTRLEVSEFGKTAEGAAKLKDALLEGLDEKFAGGMDKASQNLSVSMSNLGIAFNNALIAVGEGGLSDAINNTAQRMSEFIVNNEDLALALGEKLGQAVNLVVDGFGIFLEKMEQAQPIFDLIGTILSDVVGPALSLVFDILVKLAEAIGPIIETSLPIAKDLFSGLASIVTDVVIPAFESIIGVIDNVVGKIQFMIDKIGAGLTKVKEFGSGVKDKVTSGFSAAGDKIGGWAEDVNGWGQSVYHNWIGGSYIPDLVKGVDKHMSMLPNKMVDPVKKAVEGMNNVKQFAPMGATANSTMNFNISGINAGGAGQFQHQQMRQYVEGVALQVAHNVLRHNTGFGGIV